MHPHYREITLAPAAVCTTLQSTGFSGGMKTISRSSTAVSVPLFSLDVKTSAFRSDKAPIVATALVYKSISTTGLPNVELLTELSIKSTLGSTGGECPAVCL